MAQILITGFMGAGKTTLLHKFQALLTPNWGQFLDLDREVASHARVSQVAEIIEKDGIEHFRFLEMKVLGGILKDHSRLILALGGGTINQNTKAEFDGLMKNTIWLDTPFETCLTRIRNDQTVRPLAQISDDELRKLYSERESFYKLAGYHMGQFISPLDVLQKSGIIN